MNLIILVVLLAIIPLAESSPEVGSALPEELRKHAEEIRAELRTAFEAKYKLNKLVEDEVEHWITNLADFHYKKCSADFERNLQERRANLSLSGETTPKLNKFIEQQRENLYEECAKHHLAYLESRINMIPPACFDDLQPLVDFADHLDAKLTCNHSNCHEHPVAAKLSEIIAEQFNPPEKSAFWRWMRDQEPAQTQFQYLYKTRFEDSCFYLAPVTYDSALESFVKYLEQFWFHKTEGLVRRWLKMRKVCYDYVIDNPKTKDRAFRYLPSALKKLGKE